MWIDISNYTGPLTDEQCQSIKTAGIVGAIVQAVTGLDGNSYTVQQLDALTRNGLRIQGYVFPGGLDTKLAMFNGYQIEDLWLDVELPISIAGVDAALAQCDAYLGRPVGIYTAHWFFQNQGWLGITNWSDRRLWEALYNGVQDLDSGFVPYGGWTAMTIHQFAGTSTVGLVGQVDQDVE